MSATLRITNQTRNSVLATAANVAKTPEARKRGLIGVMPAEFPLGSGLWFEDCNAVHTVEMSMDIDILFVDVLKRRVHKAVSDAQPGCHFNCLVPAEICAVLELPAGVIAKTWTKPGDIVVIMSSTHCSQEELDKVGKLRF